MLGPLLDTGDAEKNVLTPRSPQKSGKQTTAWLVFTLVTSVVSVIFRARWMDWGLGLA